jgi:hypothetical protein
MAQEAINPTEPVSTSIENLKFNNQTFISSYIDEIMDSINQSSDNAFKYENIYKLDTVTKSFAETIALLTGKSESLKFTKLESYQYSALVPKIRLIRVQNDNKEYEFVFGKDTKYNSISDTSSLFGTPKGANGGIKFFEFKLAGTNPVTAEKQIEATLELYFDSINSFSGGDYDKMLEFWLGNSSFGNNEFDNDSNFTTTNYWSLLFHPSLKNNNYDTQLFRIKAIVGWEDIEENFKNELFQSFPEVSDEIKEDLTLSMYLNLVNHEFQFGEDGSIGLRLTYISSIENSIFNNKFDLLGGLKEDLNKLKNLSELGQLYQTQESKIRLLNYLKNNYNNLKPLLDGINNCNNFDYKQKFELSSFITQNATSNYDKMLLAKLRKYQDEELEKIQKQLELRTLEIKRQYYSALIAKILNLNLMRKISANKQTVNYFLLWKNNLSSYKPNLNNQSQLNKLDNADIQQESDTRELLIQNYEDKSQLETELSSFSFEKIYNQIENKVIIDGVKDSAKDRKELEESISNKQIIFTTVGSVIESVFSIIKENLIKQNDDLKEFDRNKIVFCNFSSDGKNIADIPISISILKEFLQKNIIEPQLETYSLHSFVQNFINEVIETALNSRDADEKIKNYSNTSLAVTVINLQGDDNTNPFNNFVIDNNFVSFNTKSKKDLKQYYIYNKLKPNKKYYTYYIIYDKYNKDFNGVGNKLEDERKGIYHFTVAQNYGLVKSLNFKRVDQPFLKEAKSIGKQTFFLGQLRDIYNVDISMVGNTIFTPGMILFVKPSVEIGNPAQKNSFSEITGVGGYYTVLRVNTKISDGEYTTSLECLFHSNVSQRTDNQSLCNIDELVKAGFLSADGAPTILSNEILTLKESLEELGENYTDAEIRRKQILAVRSPALLLFEDLFLKK